MTSLRKSFAVLFFSAFAASSWAQITESPHTIKPGKLRLEMDVISVSIDRSGDDNDYSKFTGVGVGSTFVSTGLSDVWDIQLGADLFVHRRYDRTTGGHDTDSGIGNIYMRSKWTFWEDAKLGAAAIMPYIKLPTGSGNIGNGHTEGGLIVPVSRKFAGFEVGAMFQWDYLRNPDNNGYDSDWHFTGLISRPLTRSLSVYAEGTMNVSSADGSKWAGAIGAGALLKISDSLELDFELLRGYTGAATDWNPVVRLNWDF